MWSEKCGVHNRMLVFHMLASIPQFWSVSDINDIWQAADVHANQLGIVVLCLKPAIGELGNYLLNALDGHLAGFPNHNIEYSERNGYGRKTDLSHLLFQLQHLFPRSTRIWPTILPQKSGPVWLCEDLSQKSVIEWLEVKQDTSLFWKKLRLSRVWGCEQCHVAVPLFIHSIHWYWLCNLETTTSMRTITWIPSSKNYNWMMYKLIDPVDTWPSPVRFLRTWGLICRKKGWSRCVQRIWIKSTSNVLWQLGVVRDELQMIGGLLFLNSLTAIYPWSTANLSHYQ